MSIFNLTAPDAPEPLAPEPRPPGRIPRGTDQQEALWGELTRGDRNVLVEARAGSGKSSSCREGMWRMLDARPFRRIRYAVFNKQNADEFRANCPPGVDAGTLHSFGFAALRRSHQSRVEKNKTYLILDDSPEGRNLPRYLRKSVAALVGHGKNQLVLPDSADAAAELYDLAVHYDVRTYGKPELVIRWALRVLERSRDWPGVVDFDDMVWLPAAYAATQPVDFPPCDTLFVDEAQDLNPAQHALIGLICPAGRTVAVGDTYQSIYAFRGADVRSMARLRERLAEGGLTELPLTTTFRCPRSHVELARELVPDLTAHPPNGPGVVEYASSGRMVADARPGDRVICPLNAPVISAALQLIAARQRAFVRGRALGDQLIGVVRGFGPQRTVREVSTAVDRWAAAELDRLSGLEGVEDVVDSVIDRTAGLHAILSTCRAPSEVKGRILELFTEDDRGDAVNLSTIHRAKGLEARTVWFIDSPLREPQTGWEAQQRRNLRYVALTRSRDRLVFVNSPEVSEVS